MNIFYSFQVGIKVMNFLESKDIYLTPQKSDQNDNLLKIGNNISKLEDGYFIVCIPPENPHFHVFNLYEINNFLVNDLRL